MLVNKLFKLCWSYSIVIGENAAQSRVSDLLTYHVGAPEHQSEHAFTCLVSPLHRKYAASQSLC